MTTRAHLLPAARRLAVLALLSTATAALAQAPAITASPASAAFGPQSINTTSPPRQISLSNTGTGSLTVSAVGASAGFSTSHNCGTLPPGGSCVVSVAFTPLEPVAYAGTLSVSGTMPTATVALSGSGELSLVTHYYRSILGRPADEGGKAFWTAEANRLQGLGANLNETWNAMTASFFFSPEYAAFARTDSAFVSDLYATFFNRAPDAGGLGFWSGQLQQGMPREVLLSSFTFSPEFGAFTRAIFGSVAVRPEVDTVTDFYRGLLSRLPDDGGFAYWIGEFRAAQCLGPAAVYASVDAISAAFANSPEYLARKRTDAQFVGDLYNAFLRRGGDLAGVLFWINEIASGARTREKVRKDFLASPEFTNRVAAILAQGCRLGAKSLADGSFTYLGTRPARGTVPMVARDGSAYTAHEAHLGWVQVSVDPAATAAARAAFASAGGTVIAQTPSIGLYVVQVAAGNEAAFLGQVFANPWAREGGAVTAVVAGDWDWTLDWNSPGVPSKCLAYHGSITTAIASRRGAAFALQPIALAAPTSQDVADVMARRLEDLPDGRFQVVNISIGFDLPPGKSISSYVTPTCDSNCAKAWISLQQYIFLRAFFDEMEWLSLTNPDLADRSLVTLIAGNTGVALDSRLTALRNGFPNAFKRIVIVGAADSSGTIQTSMNHAANNAAGNMVYARGVGVSATTADAGAVSCTGTSYAAPEVASVLAYVWARDPTRTSVQVVEALRGALLARGTAVIPQDAAGLADPVFLNEVAARLGLPAPACTYSYSAWSACQPNNTRTRTVLASSPPGCTGTPVTQEPCTYVPPACTYTYSAWSACVNGSQSRSVTSSSPPGCVGTPVLTQSCTNNACCACNFDVFCTVFGPGGCWRCQQSTYNSQGSCGVSGLVSPGVCQCDPGLYQVCS